MSMSDPAAQIETSHVRVKITKASEPTFWYAGMIGLVVKAERTVTTYDDGRDPAQYVKYTMFPDRHKHLMRDDVQEIEPPKLRQTGATMRRIQPRRIKDAKRRKSERQNKRKARRQS